ncbi:hypothetical protein G3I78_14055 [Streptomyces sp. SID13726]|nr:hypothetical protein [Streptomyces sp. SID13726]
MSISSNTSDGTPFNRTRSSTRSPNPSAANAPTRHNTTRSPDRAHPAGNPCRSTNASDHRNRTVASGTADGPWFRGVNRTSTRPPAMDAAP